MFYKKIRKSIMAVAIATSITSVTVMAQDQLTAKTVKTETGEIITYSDDVGKVLKKVTVTVKGNVTITETIVFDAAGKIISKMVVAELKTDEEDPKLIRREVSIENADGSTSTEVTNVTTDADGTTTSQTNQTTTNPDGSSTSTDTVTTTSSDGSSTTNATTTDTAADGTVTTTTTGDDDQGGDADFNDPADVAGTGGGAKPSEGDGAGSYTPASGYNNTP